MENIVARRKREQEQAVKLAAKYARQLRRRLGSLVAVLYGSFARGDFNPASDIDVIIISDALPHHPLRRMTILFECAPGGVEPKGLTRNEFLHMLRRHHPMAVEITQRGILLLDDGFWADVKSR